MELKTISINLFFSLLLFSSCNKKKIEDNNSLALPPANLFLVIHKEGKYSEGILSENNTLLKENLKIYTLTRGKRTVINFNLHKMVNNTKDSIFDININQENMNSFVNRGMTNIYFEKSNKKVDTLSIEIDNNNGKNKLYYIKTISYNGEKIPLLKDALGDNTFVYYLR